MIENLGVKGMIEKIRVEGKVKDKIGVKKKKGVEKMTKEEMGMMERIVENDEL